MKIYRSIPFHLLLLCTHLVISATLFADAMLDIEFLYYFAVPRLFRFAASWTGRYMYFKHADNIEVPFHQHYYAKMLSLY